MKYNLRLRTVSGEDVLEFSVDRSHARELCKWKNRNLLVQEWLEGRLADKTIEDVIPNLPSILKEKENSWLSSQDKRYIANWIVDALFPHSLLNATGENILHETLQVLLFDVLLFLPPQEKEKPAYREELLYSLRRWFVLINDPQRSWFERSGYDRERALQDAIFDSHGQIRSFYALPDFAQLAKVFARWFLTHYALATCAKIHASLHYIRNNKLPTWKKFWRPVAFLFYYKYLWSSVLSFFLLLIFTGLFSPFLGNLPLDGLYPIFVGCSAFCLLFLLIVPSDLRLPRMLGAIGVGYIVLLITADVWKIAFHMWQDHWRLALIIFFLSLLASLLYLIAEMGSQVPSWCQRCRRSLLVLGIGLAQSLLVGIVSCFLIGEVFARDVIEIQEKVPDFAKFQIHFPLFSLDFALYPEVVLFFAPLALFIGIFSQILWEEEEITSPL